MMYEKDMCANPLGDAWKWGGVWFYIPFRCRGVDYRPYPPRCAVNFLTWTRGVKSFASGRNPVVYRPESLCEGGV